MPSQFETAFAASVSALYELMGLDATYTAPDGTVTTVGLDGQLLSVRVRRNEVREMPAADRAAGEIQGGEVIVRQSQLPKPQRGGRFSIEGQEVWTIDTTPVLKNGQHYCTVSRSGVGRLMPRREKN